ncbi:FtsB family cell division protein [Agromyces sp. SYSU T0242]|uniref:FtsB family cell division protein n=1 Tax=Agromyces litoreus TaxID=3158561 RepID=UPI0033916AB2
MSAARRPSRTSRTADARPAGKGRGRPSIRQVAETWLAGIRFSGFSIIMMGMLVLAVIVLAPSIAAYAAQRQQIAEAKAEVARQEAEVARLTEERERWNDETFIVTQARNRLYYVLPGEVSYLVIDDRDPATMTADRLVSAEVTEAHGDWMQTMLRSVMTAGLAPSATDAAEPDPGAPGTDGPAAGDPADDEGAR